MIAPSEAVPLQLTAVGFRAWCTVASSWLVFPMQVPLSTEPQHVRLVLCALECKPGLLSLSLKHQVKFGLRHDIGNHVAESAT